MTVADELLTSAAPPPPDLARKVRLLRAAVLAGLILLLAGLAPLPWPDGLAPAFLGAGATLVVIGGIWLFLQSSVRNLRAGQMGLVRDFIAHDPVMSVLTDNEGLVLHANEASLERLQRDTQSRRMDRFGELVQLMLANPGGLLHRMRAKVREKGFCRDSVVTRRGQVRVSAMRVGEDMVLWRVEEVTEGDMQRAQDAIALPRLTIGQSKTVLFMNDAARKLFGKRIRALSDLSRDPLQPGMEVTVEGAEGPVRCLVARIDITGGRQEYYFLPPSQDRPTMVPATTGFDMLPVPLLELTHDGEILRANGEALRLLEASDLAQRHLSDLLEGLGRPVADWLADVVGGRAQNASEFLRVSTIGNERFVQVTLKTMANGKTPHVLAVLSDATELKTLEAQFVQSQKMQAIGQLAGGVAHDFNNLLTAISGHCDLLLLRHDQGDPDYGDLVQINQNANRAAALVSQLLAFSRKQTLRPELLDLRDTLSELTHLLNRLVGEKVRLNLNHDDNLRPVRVDKRQLEQVMMNLVVNARDAMPNGGQIEITTDIVRLRSPLKRDRAVVSPGEYVSVKVSDEGIGIAPDKLQKVFEPFYTTKRAGEGTGLGLSTVYGIVKQTGGFIFVDSVVGQGTSFTLMFPVHDEVVEVVVEEPAPAKPLQPERSDAVVLLVEDEAPVRAFASRALRLRGFTVLEAQSAEEALEKLEDPELKIDVFVTDVVMPGMDGPRWVREALKARPDTRVVFVSGYAEESFGADQTRIPNSVFLPKPFSLSELTETVQNQLH